MLFRSPCGLTGGSFEQPHHAIDAHRGMSLNAQDQPQRVSTSALFIRAVVRSPPRIPWLGRACQVIARSLAECGKDKDPQSLSVIRHPRIEHRLLDTVLD